MTNTASDRILELHRLQREYFATGTTLDLGFRKQMLRKLLEAIKKWEKPLYEALWTDLHKSEQEAFLTEVSLVTGEIRNHLRHLSCWARTSSASLIAISNVLTGRNLRARRIPNAMMNTR